MAATQQPFDVEAGAELPEVPDDRGPLKPIAETTPRERVAGIVATCAVATAVAAIIVEQSAIVFVAGILSAIIGPYAYYQQTRLTDIAALKETHEAVEAEVNRLQAENERLAANIKELGSSVEHLEEIDEALQVITSTQGQNVSAFEDQVKENREILGKMRENHQANVLQNLLSVILRCDTDGDFTMDDSEVDNLMAKLERVGGVKVRRERFRNVMANRSIDSVMDVVKNLLQEDTPEDQKIFYVE
jgi:archaellum component FlaF (FlaF/FlaG flagellin family)